MNKDLKIYLVLGVIIILIILGIFYIKSLFNNQTLDEKTAECIASKAVMYSQTSCTHCIAQKKTLGDYTKLFTIIECDKEIQKCAEAGITGTPTWIINNQTKIEGAQSIEELITLTGCGDCKTIVPVNNSPSCSISNPNSSCIQPSQQAKLLNCDSGASK